MLKDVFQTNNPLKTFKIHHEAYICVKALKEVMCDTQQYIKSSLKNCGYDPFDPSKLFRHSGSVFNIDDNEPVNTSKSKQNVHDLTRYGGNICTPQMIKFLKKIHIDDKKENSEADDDD